MRTVGILDGFSDAGQSRSTFQLDRPVDQSQPGFSAKLRLGIGFSGCVNAFNDLTGVDVNGSKVSDIAGCSDDKRDPLAANGNLITVADDADPLALLPTSRDDDHERCDIASLLNSGDTRIDLTLRNNAFDDSAFLAVFQLSAGASVTVPEPVRAPAQLAQQLPSPANRPLPISVCAPASRRR